MDSLVLSPSLGPPIALFSKHILGRGEYADFPPCEGRAFILGGGVVLDDDDGILIKTEDYEVVGDCGEDVEEEWDGLLNCLAGNLLLQAAKSNRVFMPGSLEKLRPRFVRFFGDQETKFCEEDHHLLGVVSHSKECCLIIIKQELYVFRNGYEYRGIGNIGMAVLNEKVAVCGPIA